MAPTKLTSPRSRAEPVSWYTSQFWAMDCIHVPTREVSWPKNQRRKFRCRSAWKVVARGGERPGGVYEELVDAPAAGAGGISGDTRLLLAPEVDGGQRGEREAQREGAAVPGNRLGRHSAQVAGVAAPVDGRVAVENFPVPSPFGDADAV